MNDTASQEEITKKLQQLLEERGMKALELARKTVLEEKIESKEVREALKYFMSEYWYDVTRPALLSLVCEAVGGDPNIITPVAIPMSLISGAIDIHDDLVDRSKSKWSRLTVYGKFGRNVALLVGDALLFKGFTLLYEAVKKGIPAEKILMISNIIKETFFELGDAEALELQFRGRLDVLSEDYLRVVRKKAADVEAYLRIGSILGKGTQKEIKSLRKYGRLLGMMIILNDDLFDMNDFGEFMNRIKNEHIPLQIIYALEKSRDKSQFNLILRKRKKTKDDFKKIIDFTKNAEGPILVAKKMKSIVDEAEYHLQGIKKNKQYFKYLVESLLPSVIEGHERD
jgi:geranylgeranyl pyrophosphate synthase